MKDPLTTTYPCLWFDADVSIPLRNVTMWRSKHARKIILRIAGRNPESLANNTVNQLEVMPRVPREIF